MDVATVVDILFLHIFLTGKTGKVDMFNILITVKVCPPVHNYEHEAGSYGDGFT